MSKLFKVFSANNIIKDKLPHFKFEVVRMDSRVIVGLFWRKIDAIKFANLKENNE